jgi:hypothetical protein
MRFLSIFASVVLLLKGADTMAQTPLPQPDIPAAKDVIAIRFEGGETTSLKLAATEISEPERIGVLMHWLRHVDWSHSQDVRRLLLPKSLRMDLVKADGSKQTFYLIKGGVIHDVRLWQANTAQVKAVLEKK